MLLSQPATRSKEQHEARVHHYVHNSSADSREWLGQVELHLPGETLNVKDLRVGRITLNLFLLGKRYLGGRPMNT